ncbi:type II toxin-antitoxin system RelE/ParE family toxin [Marinilabiliaceae bacterium JC017]|nr:type II toxin-antitoxin system RelE/ParE family toxin [Marinilabiliaceae bacterium JC017]
MEAYQIVWTSRAVKDLRKVYNFNVEVRGEDKAFELTQFLIDRVTLLSNKKFIEMGVVDEDFKHLKRTYRKLIEGDVKITYRISSLKSIVYINRVFDMRQNPKKNK